MFKLLCFLTLTLCGTQSPGSSDESWHLKFHEQRYPPESDIPCGLKIQDLPKIWEECKNKHREKSRNNRFFINDTYNTSYIIQTDYHEGYKQRRLCFVVEEKNNNLYYIIEHTSSDGTIKYQWNITTEEQFIDNKKNSERIKRYSEIESRIESEKSSKFYEWRNKPTFNIYDGENRLVLSFSSNENSKNKANIIVTLKAGVELSRDQFLKLIDDCENAEQDAKKDTIVSSLKKAYDAGKMFKTIPTINSANLKINLVQNPFGYERIWFQLVETPQKA